MLPIQVEKSSFFLNRDIETLITTVETSVINDLEGGNRQAGMKRLKVGVPDSESKVGSLFITDLDLCNLFRLFDQARVLLFDTNDE